jgi:hypothetical protein
MAVFQGACRAERTVRISSCYGGVLVKMEGGRQAGHVDRAYTVFSLPFLLDVDVENRHGKTETGRLRSQQN